MRMLLRPIISEKATNLSINGGYVFLVVNTANKSQIAREVEKSFSVKVEKVNITTFQGKKKRIANSRKFALTSGGKKATVWVAKGDTINFTDTKKTRKKSEKGKKEK